jgi:signal peptide peptidase SppA
VSNPYQHIVGFALDHPWAITPAMLATVADVLARKIAGKAVSAEDLQAALTKRDNLPRSEGRGGVAVIPIHGVIVPRGNMMTDVSGATSLDSLSAALREAMANDKVETIVLDVDSPGGSVAGTTEFAREVMRARVKKPIVAMAQYTMASAAYWIAAAATEIVASPSAMVGSVGVYAMHEDLSRALETVGIKRTYISAGKHKVDGNEAEPLSTESRATMQRRVDDAYSRFLTDISRGRGVAIDAVRSGFGEGRTVGAEEALSLGMIDHVATFDETVSRLLAGAPIRGRQMAAEASTTQELATSQEPSPATDQEPVPEKTLSPLARERMAFERAVFELSL